MEIRVNIKKIFDDPNRIVKGYATIVLDECFIIKDIKIIQGSERLLIAMPSRKLKNGEWIDTCHPISKEFRTELEEAVLDAYEAYEEEGESE